MKKLVGLSLFIIIAALAHHKIQRRHVFFVASDATTVSPDFGIGDDGDMDDGLDCDDDDDYMLA